MSIKLDPVAQLPFEDSLMIFSFLNVSELGKCAQVSKSWRAVSGHNSLWRDAIINACGGIPEVPNFKKFLKNLYAQNVYSNDGLIDRLEKFMQKVTLGQHARFRCTLQMNADVRTLSVEIKSRGVPSDRKETLGQYDLSESCILSRGMGKGALVKRCACKPVFKNIEEKRQYAPVCVWKTDRIVTFTLSGGSFSGILSFPEHIETSGNQKTDLECQIEDLIKMKLSDLSKEQNKIHARRACIAIAIAFLGITAAKHFNAIRLLTDNKKI